MIPRRHAWLLRDGALAFEEDFGYGHACKLCAALERPQARLRRADLARHLAAHRAEKITTEPEPAFALAIAAIETEEL